MFSAHIGDNDKCFAQLMAAHVPDGATVADVTYGRGNFWKCVPQREIRLVKASRLADGVDCRNLPHTATQTIDAVVLDPPISLFFRPHKVGEAYQDFHRYSAGFAEDGPRYRDGVLAYLWRRGQEAWRVLKPDWQTGAHDAG